MKTTGIHDAKGSHHEPAGREQVKPRVKPDSRLVHDQGQAGEPAIRGRVVYVYKIGRVYRAAAERGVAWIRLRLNSDRGLTPFPLGVNERGSSDRRAAGETCEKRDLVKLGFARGIEDTVVMNGLEPHRFALTVFAHRGAVPRAYGACVHGISCGSGIRRVGCRCKVRLGQLGRRKRSVD